MSVLEVPNDPEDKRRPYDPKIDRISVNGGMQVGSSNAKTKDDKIVVTGVE